MSNKKNSKKRYSLDQYKRDNFLFFLIISFFFIASTSLALTRNSPEPNPVLAQAPEYADIALETDFPLLPAIKDDSQTFPVVSAQAALAIDLNSGIPLFEKNPDEALLPASTTKIVTALVTLDYYDTDTFLTVGKIKKEGQRMGLYLGEEISVQALLDGLLIFSANDAAEVLAASYEGGTIGFVNAMNQKAEEMNMKNTYFTNPAGFDGSDHVSTARDLVRISAIAMRNPKFARIVGQTEKVVTSKDKKIVHRLKNTNKLLGKVDGVIGVKTGWTENARENLVTYLERDGKKIIFVVLGSQDRFGETEEIIDWVFSNYSWEEVKMETP